MKKYLIAFLLVPTTALADPPPLPQPYANIVIDQTTYEQMRTWLMEQPAKFSIPMLNTLATLEQRAQEAAKPKEKEDAK